MMKYFILITAAVVLAGCATTRSEINISPNVAKAVNATATLNGNPVYIQTVNDKRDFEERPSKPNIPSLNSSAETSDSIKHRAVARKRNSFGKAWGDILLQEDQSVESLVASAIRQAYSEKGYKVLDKPEQITPDATVVDADITKFWSWFRPGFWAITISAEISTDLSIKTTGETKKLTVYVKSADTFQTGMESNYTDVIVNAVKLYTNELKSKLN